jgi:antitoxin component of MazEF toxin-antitoxin module
MTQKIIKIGSSAGITIPKSQLEELGLTVGDEITVDIKPASDTIKQFAGELDKFMDIYEQDLKNLAQK